MSSTLKGHEKLQVMLKMLGSDAAARIARRTAVAGARVLEREMVQRAPGRVKDEIGISTPLTDSKFKAEAKVGVGVGRAARIAAVGRFLALGTKERFRRTSTGIASTGFVEPQPFVREAVDSASGAASSAMERAMRESLKQEIAKARK